MREQTMVRAGHVLRRVGAAALATGLQPSDNVRVALTHHVAPSDYGNFERLIDQLCSERLLLDAADILQIYARPRADAIKGKHLAFTFDDGLLSSFQATQAILNPRGAKAIFFIPTRILDLRTPDEMHDFFRQNVYRRANGDLPRHKYMTMTADHLRMLRDQGHTVLPHTHSHVSLLSLETPEDIDRELRRPKLLLEDLLQTPCDGFAFPFGTDQVVHARAYEAIRRLYAVCFTALGGVNGPATDRYTLRRDCLHPYHLPNHVANVSAGAYDLYYTHKMRRLRRRVGPSPT